MDRSGCRQIQFQAVSLVAQIFEVVWAYAGRYVRSQVSTGPQTRLCLSRARSFFREIAPVLLCVAAGLLLSSLPHLVSWVYTGRPIWIADHDDLDDYLVLAAHAYHQHPGWLSDPVVGSGAVSYPWLEFVPGIAIARFLRTGPLYINLVWRVIGGVAGGIAWLAATRQFIRGRWIACWAAIYAMSDTGLFV